MTRAVTMAQIVEGLGSEAPEWTGTYVPVYGHHRELFGGRPRGRRAGAIGADDGGGDGSSDTGSVMRLEGEFAWDAG